MVEDKPLSEKVIIAEIDRGVFGAVEEDRTYHEDHVKQKVKEAHEEIGKKVLNSRMYADMDEDDFWRTSTISPQEAETIATCYEKLFIEITQILKDKFGDDWV